MKRSELKNEIESGIRMTCGSWGESYLMLDEQAAFEAMVESFGGDAGDYEKQRDEERGDDDISIYEINGKFYAVSEGKFIECDNPKTCESGLLDMHGKWESFDDEDGSNA